MRVNQFSVENRPVLKHVKSHLKNQTAKIIHFTGGKPTSEELSDVLKVANQVKEESIIKFLKELAGPETEGRGVGQPGIEKAKEYIGNKFKEFGLVPVKDLGLNDYYETFELPQYPVRSMQKGPYIYGSLNHWGTAKDVKSSNVLGMIKGTEKPDEYIIVSGHYDHLGKDMKAGYIYPGANDDASGVVAMLETAKILSQGKAPKKSIIFAALTGEESGWLGANNLAKDLVSKGMAKNVEVLNVEMIAPVSGNKVDIWDQRMPEAQGMVNNIVKAGKELGMKVKVNHDTDPGSDSIRFSTYDIPAICLAGDFDWSNHPTYHCAEDTPEGINKKFFFEAARLAAASASLIANDTTPKLAPMPTEENMRQLKELQVYRQRALDTKTPL